MIKDLNAIPDTIKLLEKIIGRTLFDINHGSNFLYPHHTVMRIKKINKCYQNKLKKLLHSKGNHKQNKNTTHRMGENICKRWGQQGVSLQNISTQSLISTKKNLIKK